MEKITVLVADDHPAFREGLCRLLKDETDFQVVGMAEDGEQAVQSATKLRPDVAIIDISMPKLNGIEAARQIRVASPSTAILVVSAYSYPSYVLAALRAGAVGYLSKNAPLHELISAVRLIHSGEGVFDLKATGNILNRLATDRVEKRKDLAELHPRELQVLNLAAKGVGNKEIANRLGISERTVQTHLVNIFRKLSVRSRTEAVLRALKEGWFTLDDLANKDHTDG
jgi:two-component system, NarL family, response regulator LiaR